MARAFAEETRAEQIGNQAVTQPSNSQSVDRKVLLLLRRKGTQTIEGLTMLAGIGWGQAFLSVDRLSRTGKVSLTAVYPSEYRVSVARAGGFTKVISPRIANSENIKPSEAIMARAFTEKTSAEQIGSHTVSSAIMNESTCDRCGGLMVTDFYMDLLFCIGETEFAAQRCVQCGEIVDPVILRNRQLRQNSMAVQFAGKTLPNNCVARSR